MPNRRKTFLYFPSLIHCQTSASRLPSVKLTGSAQNVSLFNRGQLPLLNQHAYRPPRRHSLYSPAGKSADYLLSRSCGKKSRTRCRTGTSGVCPVTAHWANKCNGKSWSLSSFFLYLPVSFLKLLHIPKCVVGPKVVERDLDL